MIHQSQPQRATGKSRRSLSTLAQMAGVLGMLAVSQACTPEQRMTNVSGEALYDQCQMCHGEQGQGRQELAAPAIAALPKWYLVKQLKKYQEGVRGNHPADKAGQRMMPMARVLRYEGNIEKISEYVANMPRTEQPSTVVGNPLAGEAQYGVCIACHGPAGLGNEALGSPPLIGQSDWYMLSQLKHFKNGIRGGNPAIDMDGASMRAIAMTIPDEKAMRDLVAYIRTLNEKADEVHGDKSAALESSRTQDVSSRHAEVR